MTRVAVVSDDPSIRDAAARAFEGAPSSWIVSLESNERPDTDVVVWGADRYPGAGILFEPADPGRAVRSIRETVSPQRIVSVSAAGGGQGATTVAAHLAAYAAGKADVCLVDAQPGSATRYRIGVPFEESKSWSDAGDDLLLAALPTTHGFRVLLAPPSDEGEVAEIVHRSSVVFDRVVIDAGTARPPVENAVRVLVLSPTKPAAHMSRRLLWSDDGRWVVATNRLGRGGETSRAELEEILETSIAVELPHCPALRDAEDEGRLIAHSWTRWWWAFQGLCEQLEL
ncbi:MAG: hypothetical protein QOF16_17 [Actinomycetota bacterium]|nr:hypothetical protein [Actinomycetota bacterium]